MEASGELMFTILSSLAQEESRNISENTAWGIRSKFQRGIPHLGISVPGTSSETVDFMSESDRKIFVDGVGYVSSTNVIKVIGTCSAVCFDPL